MGWLGYPSQAAAQANVATINGRMGLPIVGDVTQTWAIPKADINGQWWIPAPDDTTGLSGTPGTPAAWA